MNGAITVPMGPNNAIMAKGFWANIEDDDSFSCVSTATLFCTFMNVVDDPAVGQALAAAAAGRVLTTNTEREVDYWGVSLEVKQQLNPAVMGVTQAPPLRTLALGADMRGIDPDLSIDALVSAIGGVPATGTYREAFGNGSATHTFNTGLNKSSLFLAILDDNDGNNPYSLHSILITPIPLPAAFPLFGTGLGILGFLGWRRRRRLEAVLGNRHALGERDNVASWSVNPR